MMTATRVVCRLQAQRSKRATLSLLLSSLTGLLTLSACGISERPQIGRRMDSPVALASHPSRPVYYVLNASLSGEFESGSLQAYAVPTDVNSSSAPLATLPTPRLGTSLAVVKGAELLIAGFAGSAGELRVFKLDAQGLPSLAERPADRVVLPAGRIGSVQVNPVDGQSGVWSVVVSIADRSLDARVVVLKYSQADGFSKLAELPTDFYTPSRENPLGNYAMAWGVPTVFPSLGIVAAFPQGSVGYLGKNPSALSWLSGQAGTPDPNVYDLRTVSAAVIDLNALMQGQPLQRALGFVPLAFNSSAQKGNPTAASDATGNSDYQFRAGYQSSFALDTQSSTCSLTGPFSTLAANTAVVAINSDSADIVAFSGWNDVANQLRTRLTAGDVQPVLGDVLTPSAVSLTAGIASLSGIRTFVPSFQLVNSGNSCLLSWIRVEQLRSSLGAEQSRLQIANEANASAQVSRDLSLPGMAAFTVNGQTIMSGSFSNNKVQVLRWNGTTLENVGVFSP